SAGGAGAAAVAADSLGEIGGERAVLALVRALFEPDAAVRRAASVALRRASLGRAGREERAALPPPAPLAPVRDYSTRLVRARASSAPVRGLEAWARPIEAAAAQALDGTVEQVLAALSVLASGAPETSPLGLGPLTEGLEQWPAGERSSAERA